MDRDTVPYGGRQMSGRFPQSPVPQFPPPGGALVKAPWSVSPHFPSPWPGQGRLQQGSGTALLKPPLSLLPAAGCKLTDNLCTAQGWECRWECYWGHGCSWGQRGSGARCQTVPDPPRGCGPEGQQHGGCRQREAKG